MRVVMLIVGLVLLGAGVGLGFVPTTATTAIPDSVLTRARVDTYSCGSPWSVDREAIDKQQGVNDQTAMQAVVTGTLEVAENTTDLCARAFGARGTWGAVAAAMGALTLLGAGLVVMAQQTRRRGPAAAP